MTAHCELSLESLTPKQIALEMLGVALPWAHERPQSSWVSVSGQW